MKALAAALDHCEAMCVKGFLIAGVVKQCTNFYFLKDAATGKESCRFYEIGEDVRAYIEDLGYHARSTDESKWNLCIWQPGSQFVGQKLPLCNAKVSRTPAEEAAEKAARVKAYYDRKAAEEAARQAAIDKEARELQEKAQEERLEFQGEVGERTQFRNKLQGKCLAALDGPSGNLTWSDCSDRSDTALWTMRADGSYESAAHPDRCPREGDGARCQREYVVLGACPGFVTWSVGYGLNLKLVDDELACLETWWKSSYDAQGVYDAVVPRPLYEDHVMTSRSKTCHGYGVTWEKVVVHSGGSGGDAPASSTSLAGCPDGKMRLERIPEKHTKMSEALAFRCCNMPKNNIQNNTKVLMSDYGCHTGTYSEAIDMCEEKGLALCTTDQIKEKTQCGSGCLYDSSRVWTRTL